MPMKGIEKRVGVMQIIAGIIFIVLFSRLAYMQLIEQEKYSLMAQSNRIQLATVTAARGEILDRQGKVLARSRPSFNISVALVDLKKEDQEEVFRRLAPLLGMKAEDISNLVKQQPKKYVPVPIAEDVSLDVVTRIEERRMELPGVIVEVKPQREYVYGDFLSHVLGYVRQPSQEFLQKMIEEYPEEDYKLNDKLGITGIERWFETELHGKDGARQVEVDARMRPVRDLGLVEPVPGKNLILTIDSELQRVAEESLTRTMAQIQREFPEAKGGAVVVINVKTGEVLAMASKPSFDPNRFNRPISKQEWETTFSDKLPFPPLLNRAIAPFAPGSTFKMVTATAALETKAIGPGFSVYDPGYYQLGNRKFKCWQISGHGRVDLKRAIQVSCNTFFFTAGLAAGNDQIARYAQEFGLGEKTGITLPGESTGTVPTEEWKKALNARLLKWRYDGLYADLEEKYKNKLAQAQTEEEKAKILKQKEKEKQRLDRSYQAELEYNTAWHAYDTLNMSIGQGANQYTPLQLANYTAVIANGGYLYRPQLVKRIVDHSGKTIKEFKPELIRKVNVSDKTLKLLREGMLAVTQPGGTAAGRFAGFPVKVAGKTGTAQVFGKDNHGLFVGFAPYENPEIAIACIVEHGGHGGTSAGVVARDVLAAYFKIPQDMLKKGGSSAEE